MPPESVVLPPGPLKTVAAFGTQMPYYVLTFDKDGRCTSPRTADDLVERLRGGVARDVILYSHGWNNDYPTAIGRYDIFLQRLSAAALGNPGTLPSGFSPVFVGIVWPSTALTFGFENAPDIAAAAGPEALAAEASADADEAAQLLGAIGEADRDEVARLLDQDGIDEAAAARLAQLIAPCLDDTAYEIPDEPGAAEDLLEAWRSEPTPDAKPAGSLTQFGTANAGAEAGDVQAAGLLDNLDPRWIVRVATVLLMKTRAGVVGKGVAGLVERILALPGPRLHLVGHSYGAKVVMSALAAKPPPRPAEAVMLLQPAVSHLCFAEDTGDGRPGGFRRALDHIRKPLLVTWSRNDLPLRRLFHLAARRKSDVGEVQVLGAPSRYWALGGFGPSNCAEGECQARVFAQPPQANALPAPPARIVAFDGSGVITGHDDVHNAKVIWAMCGLLH